MGARILWISIVAALLAFGVHTFFGSIISAASEERVKSITARDSFDGKMHSISGMVMVPSTCHTLTVRAHGVTPAVTALVFETWEQPYRPDCIDELTPRQFSVDVFAEEQHTFRAILDTQWIPLQLVRI